MEGGFAAARGVLFQEAFFDGFVVFALSLAQIFGGRFGFEGFESAFDEFFDFGVFLRTLNGLASLFFGGFDYWHSWFP